MPYFNKSTSDLSLAQIALLTALIKGPSYYNPYGSHLAELLVAKSSLEVHGIVRWRSKTENIDHIKPTLHLHECDLRDAAAVTAVMSEVRPDVTFHFNMFLS